MKNLSIIIVSYNTNEVLRECLASVFGTIDNSVDAEIIVVDNASSDGSCEMIRKEFPETILIENKKNVGFSKANNKGVEKSSGKYVLFLNSDTLVYKNSIIEILKFLDNTKDAGAVTCKVELLTGEIDDASHRAFPTPWNALTYFSGLSKIFPSSKLFGGYNLGWLNMKETHEIEALAGAFMMVKRQAGDMAGWWDEDYFWYGDDLDFCYRLKEKGWKIYYVPTVKILHYKGVSGGIKEISQHLTTADEQTRKKASAARFDAMKTFYSKHYKKKYPFFLTWLVFRGIDLKKLLS